MIINGFTVFESNINFVQLSYSKIFFNILINFLSIPVIKIKNN